MPAGEADSYLTSVLEYSCVLTDVDVDVDVYLVDEIKVVRLHILVPEHCTYSYFVA